MKSHVVDQLYGVVCIQDIAFKIVNREWEYSYKRGFRCQFHNNIFQLWFHFKRYRYRRWCLSVSVSECFQQLCTWGKDGSDVIQHSRYVCYCQWHRYPKMSTDNNTLFLYKLHKKKLLWLWCEVYILNEQLHWTDSDWVNLVSRHIWSHNENMSWWWLWIVLSLLAFWIDKVIMTGFQWDYVALVNTYVVYGQLFTDYLFKQPRRTGPSLPPWTHLTKLTKETS